MSQQKDRLFSACEESFSRDEPPLSEIDLSFLTEIAAHAQQLELPDEPRAKADFSLPTARKGSLEWEDIDNSPSSVQSLNTGKQTGNRLDDAPDSDTEMETTGCGSLAPITLELTPALSATGKKPAKTKGMKYKNTKGDECPLCKKKYTGANSLRNHLRKKHKILRPAQQIVQLRKVKDGRRRRRRADDTDGRSNPTAPMNQPTVVAKNTSSPFHVADFSPANPMNFLDFHGLDDETPRRRNSSLPGSADTISVFGDDFGALPSRLGNSSTPLSAPLAIGSDPPSVIFSKAANLSNVQSSRHRSHPYLNLLSELRSDTTGSLRHRSDSSSQISGSDVGSPLSDYLLPSDVFASSGSGRASSQNLLSPKFSSGSSFSRKQTSLMHHQISTSAPQTPTSNITSTTSRDSFGAVSNRSNDWWIGVAERPITGRGGRSKPNLDEGLHDLLFDPVTLAEEISEIVRIANEVLD